MVEQCIVKISDFPQVRPEQSRGKKQMEDLVSQFSTPQPRLTITNMSIVPQSVSLGSTSQYSALACAVKLEPPAFISREPGEERSDDSSTFLTPPRR